VAIAAAVGLAIRVIYVLGWRDGIDLGGDSFFYSVGADLLVDGQGFVDPIQAVTPGPDEQSASHPPLYLLYLAIASFVHPGGIAESQLTHMLWSCLLGTGTVIVCGLAGRKIAGPRAGVIAAVFAAVYPNLWVHDGMLLSETMALFATAMVILLTYRFIERPNVPRVAWLGLCCGLAALARAELVFLIPLLLAVCVVFVVRKAVPWRERLRLLAVGGIAAAVAIGPWVAFNFSRFEESVYFTHAAGFTMAASNCEETYEGDGIGFKNYDCAHEYAVRSIEPGMDPSEREHAIRAETMEWVRDNLDRLPPVVLARWGRIMGLYRPDQDIANDVFFLIRERGVAEASLYSYYVAAVLAIAGGVVLRRRRVPVLPLVAVPVVVLIAVTMTFAQSRYRAPVEVVLVILAAVAVDAAISAVASRRRRPGRHEGRPPLDESAPTEEASPPGAAPTPPVPARRPAPVGARSRTAPT